MKSAKYIENMRAEAEKRREEAAEASGDHRDWLLSRAAFFDACADDATPKTNDG